MNRVSMYFKLKSKEPFFQYNTFKNQTFNAISFDNAIFNRCQFVNCKFKNVTTNKTILHNIRFVNCSFDGMSFKNIMLNVVLFDNCNLQYTRWENVDIISCKFNHVLFYDNVYERIKFQNTEIYNSKFESRGTTTIMKNNQWIHCQVSNLEFKNVIMGDIYGKNSYTMYIPTILNIHQRVYSMYKSMTTRKLSDCDKEICLAKWVTSLADDRETELVSEVGYTVASMLLYLKSDPKSGIIPNFHMKSALEMTNTLQYLGELNEI